MYVRPLRRGNIFLLSYHRIWTLFGKASAYALSFYSTSATSSPLSGSVYVDRHGFLKLSQRVRGPMLCSLQALTITNVVIYNQDIPQISLQAQIHITDILEGLAFGFID